MRDYKELIKYYEKVSDQSDDMFLFGWLDISNEEYEELLSLCKEIVYRRGRQRVAYLDRDIVLTMTIVEYSRRSFMINKPELQGIYESFFDYLGFNLSTNEIKEYSDRIYDVLKEKSKIIEYKDELNNVNRRLKDSVLMQSVINNFDAEKIFLIFVDIYFKHLKENINYNNVNTFLERFYIATQDYFKASRVYTEKAKGLTNILQEFPVYFLHANNYSPWFVKKIMMEWFSYIHAINNNHEPVYKKNKYSGLFKQVRRNINIERKFRTKKSNARKEYKKHQFGSKSLTLSSNSLILHIASHNIGSETDKDYKVVVYVDDKIYRTINLTVLEEEFGFFTESKNILINQMSTDIRYEIFTDNEVLYSSKDYFIRDYYIFNYEDRLVSAYELTLDYEFKIISKYPIHMLSNMDSSGHYRKDELYYLESHFDEETEIIINDALISSKMNKIENGFSSDSIFQDISFSRKEHIYPIVKTLSAFHLNLKEEEYISDYVISINGKSYDLDNLNNAEVISQRERDVVIQLDISKILRLLEIPKVEGNIYDVKLYKKGDKYYRYNLDFVYIKQISYHFAQELYTNEKHVELKDFYTSMYPDIEYYGEKLPANPKGTFTLRINQNEKFIIDVPCVFVNEKNNYIKRVWHEDFTIDSLKYRGLGNHPIWEIEVGNSKQSISLGSKKNNGFTDVNTAKLADIHSVDALNVYINDTSYRVIEKIKSPEIFKLDAFVIEDKIVVAIDYVGSKNMIVRIETNTGYISEKEINTHIEFLERPSAYFIYNISVIDRKRTLFKTEEVKVATRKFIHGDPLILSSKEKDIKVDSIVSDGEVYEVNNCYVQFMKVDKDHNNYLGKLYHYRKDSIESHKKCYYDAINAVHMNKLLGDNDNELYSFGIEDRNHEFVIFDNVKRFINTDTSVRNYARYIPIDEIVIRKDELIV